VKLAPLGREQIAAILDIQVRLLQERLAARRLTISLTDAAREYLANAGFDPSYGARPLKRLIQREVQDRLATILEVMLADDRRSWQLQPDASWVRTETLEGRDGTIDTFEVMKEEALRHGGVIAAPRRAGSGTGSLDPRA